MDKKDTLTITLSDEELYVVLIYLGAESLIGFDAAEAINSKAEDTRRDILATAERALVARGFLVLEEGKSELTLIAPVLAAVGACAYPDVSLTVGRQAKDTEPEIAYFHLSRKMAVLHGKPMTGIHSFIAFESAEKLQEGLNRLMQIGTYQAADYPAYTIPGQVLARVRELLQTGGVKEAATHLQTAGLDTATASAFAADILAMRLLMSFSRVNRADGIEKMTASFTILEGQEHLWRLTNTPEGDSVIVETASDQAVREAVGGLLVID